MEKKGVQEAEPRQGEPKKDVDGEEDPRLGQEVSRGVVQIMFGSTPSLLLNIYQAISLHL